MTKNKLIVLPKTPSKLYVHKHNLDRFSPARSSSNLELAGHFTQTSQNPRGTLNVFSFNTSQSPHSPSNLHLPSLEMLEKENTTYKFDLSPLVKSPHCSHAKKSPHVNFKLQCIRTLDAPGLSQNEHYHLMDWFSAQDNKNNNLLAIALGSQIFIYDVTKEVIIQIFGTENDENAIIDCLKWNLKSPILAYTTKSSETASILNGPRIKILNCLNSPLQSLEVLLIHRKKLSVLSTDVINHLVWASKLIAQGTLLKSTNNCCFAIWDTSDLKNKYPILTWNKHLKFNNSLEKTLIICMSSHNPGYFIALISHKIFIWFLNYSDDANNINKLNGILPTLLSCKDVHMEDCIPNDLNSGQEINLDKNQWVHFTCAKWYPWNSKILVCCGSYRGKDKKNNGIFIFLHVEQGSILKTRTIICAIPVVDIVFSSGLSMHSKTYAFFSAHKLETTAPYDIAYWEDCGQPNVGSTLLYHHHHQENSNGSYQKTNLGGHFEISNHEFNLKNTYFAHEGACILSLVGDVHNVFLATLASDETIKIWRINNLSSAPQQKAMLNLPESSSSMPKCHHGSTGKLDTFGKDFLSFL